MRAGRQELVRPPPSCPLAGQDRTRLLTASTRPASASGGEKEKAKTLAHDDHPRQVEVTVRPAQAQEGLSHSGEPESEEEAIVLEEPERPEVCDVDADGTSDGPLASPNVIRAPRDPTQK